VVDFSAVVLAGGAGRRLGGVDKGALELGGRTLLARALDAVAGAGEVVVVGEPVDGVRTVREEPAYGGPVAGLYAGRDALREPAPWLVVLAVDMPRVTAATVQRLLGAARGDGAVLVGPDGRRQLALVVAPERLDAVRPDVVDGAALHRTLAGLDLAEVAAVGDEHRDVDTWADLT
jgi:molybdopterin-guanine dinucleotide biosynthesis protein A